MKFVLCTLCLVLSACAYDYRMFPQSIAKATEYCAPHGGFEYIIPTLNEPEAQTISVRCKNGVAVSVRVSLK